MCASYIYELNGVGTEKMDFLMVKKAKSSHIPPLLHGAVNVELPQCQDIPQTDQFSSVQFNSSVLSDSLWPHESQHARPPCPSPAPRVYPNSCPLSRWCHPTISFSVIPFSSCPQSFPASGSFQMSWFFASGGQSNFTSSCLFISIKLINNKILNL